jgi:aminobenzoyl-glutamate utilization protein B
MALTVVDYYVNPELADQARTELMENRGSDFNYAPLLGERAPALDYRLKQ